MYYKLEYKGGCTYTKVIENRTSSKSLMKSMGTSIKGFDHFESIQVTIEDSEYWPYVIHMYKQDPSHYMRTEITEEEFNKAYVEALSALMPTTKTIPEWFKNHKDE